MKLLMNTVFLKTEIGGFVKLARVLVKTIARVDKTSSCTTIRLYRELVEVWISKFIICN